MHHSIVQPDTECCTACCIHCTLIHHCPRQVGFTRTHQPQTQSTNATQHSRLHHCCLLQSANHQPALHMGPQGTHTCQGGPTNSASANCKEALTHTHYVQCNCTRGWDVSCSYATANPMQPTIKPPCCIILIYAYYCMHTCRAYCTVQCDMCAGAHSLHHVLP
jgi:hypothetical protein